MGFNMVMVEKDLEVLEPVRIQRDELFERVKKVRKKKVQMPHYIDHVKVYIDGGCRGNPGPGAIGVLVLDGDGNELRRDAECIGDTTNNRAEYHAVIKGLSVCAEYTRGKVTLYSDSELVVKQMNGRWRLKNNELRELFVRVRQYAMVFEEVVYTHVKRTNPYIEKVDRALNEALEGR
jgi:ribonuclease HI